MIQILDEIDSLISDEQIDPKECAPKEAVGEIPACQRCLYAIILQTWDDLQYIHNAYCVEQNNPVLFVNPETQNMLKQIKIFFKRDCKDIIEMSMGPLNPYAIESRAMKLINEVEKKWETLEFIHQRFQIKLDSSDINDRINKARL